MRCGISAQVKVSIRVRQYVVTGSIRSKPLLLVMLHPAFGIVLQHAEAGLDIEMQVLGPQAEGHAVEPVLLSRRQKCRDQFLCRARAIRFFDELFEPDNLH
jgi:hypothetical protein